MILTPNEDTEVSTVFGAISPLITWSVLPVGKWFESHHSGESGKPQQAARRSPSPEESDDIPIEVDTKYILGLVAKEWKTQDHYRVLGLHKLRIKASEDTIKKAYNKLCKIIHPDKNVEFKNAGPESEYFTCITKAYEILSNKTSRRSYDSVDPEFNNDIPDPDDLVDKKDFYETFTDAFGRNERWSQKQPVPKLGADDTPIEKVDSFYNFWYNFDSWREFSYLESDDEKGECREERRWIERQKKGERQKKKREETQRIRQMVDGAYSVDPRILRFKEEQKKAKEDAKAAKRKAAQERAEMEARMIREAEEAKRLAKEKEEAEAKRVREEAKRARQEQKKARQNQKEILVGIFKQNNYFSKTTDERIKHIEESEKMFLVLPIEKLQELSTNLSNVDEASGRTVFLKEIKELREAKEREESIHLQKASSDKNDRENKDGGGWNPADLQLLIKAVNLFPGATVHRWNVVANYVNQHSGSDKKRTAKEVQTKAADLRKIDPTTKQEMNKLAFEQFTQQQQTVAVESAPSERFETPAEQLGLNPWTSEEQKLLEQALKTYPSTTPQRWDRIAECVPGRSKKDCMKRFKELAEMVKAKKLAMAETTKK